MKQSRPIKTNRFYSSIKKLTEIITDDNLSEEAYQSVLFFFKTSKYKYVDLYWNASTNELMDCGVPNETIFLTCICRKNKKYLIDNIKKAINILLESQNKIDIKEHMYIDSGKYILEQFSDNTVFEIISSELYLLAYLAKKEMLKKEIVLETISSEFIEGENILYLFKYDKDRIFIKKEIVDFFNNKGEDVILFYKNIFSTVYNELYTN